MHPKLLLAAGTFEDTAIEEEEAGGRAEITLARLGTPADVATASAYADAVLVTNNLLTKDHIAALGENVRVIGRIGVGLDAIDLDAARERGVAVVHLPDYATNEVATHAVALILALHRRLREADIAARTMWSNWRSIGSITPIEEQVVGIVGAGRIGSAVIRRLVPFAGEIIFHDPFVATADHATSVESLNELLERADVVSLHVPFSAGDPPLIGAGELARMKGATILVNVSRGGLVDEVALAAALTDGRLAGAALDVLASEPPDSDAAIIRAPRTLLTPHIGWYSTAAEPRARRQIVASVLDVLAGKPPRYGRLAVPIAS